MPVDPFPSSIAPPTPPATVTLPTPPVPSGTRTAKRKALDGLRQYPTDRLGMLDHRTALARGWDVGSGPTEAMCKTLTLRLRRPGTKWDRDHASGVMNPQAMYGSGQAATHWSQCRAAA